MERTHRLLTLLDELYLQRTYELAARALGNTSPNPPVGAVIVRDGRIVGQGYHHRAGDAHAEVHALAQAEGAARGATLYVSLEPCGHVGRTPPCAPALLDAGIERVVAGTLDPTRHGGAVQLREGGVDVVVAESSQARELIEVFARGSGLTRPYIALKMAMSLDGQVAGRRGVQEWLTSDATRLYVRELRVRYDAVMVGAGTVRVDDPLLTVRPPHTRLREYVRIVVCETAPVSPLSRVFGAEEGYAKSIVIAPRGLADRFAPLEAVAELLYAGTPQTVRLDLHQALAELRARGIASVLCEGGPTLAAQLLAGAQVDRVYWAVAPLFLSGEGAIPVLAGDAFSAGGAPLRVDRVERVGTDVVIGGTFGDV